MTQHQAAERLGSDVRALQWDAMRAGLAWACPFSTSEEFEAAVIRSRLRAGVYGPKRRRRQLLYATAAAAAIAVAWLLFQTPG
jgi:hypothetical protein